MYELFTLGGGVYLVDLLNAVAAITGGGAFIALAQLAGVAGLAWILFRTAFGGSWRDNGKWVLMFTAVWGAMIVPRATVRVVDRLDPALAPAVVANVPIGLALFASLTSEVGDGLTRLLRCAEQLLCAGLPCAALAVRSICRPQDPGRPRPDRREAPTPGGAGRNPAAGDGIEGRDRK